LFTYSAIFIIKKVSSGVHSGTEFGRMGGLVIPMPEKKVLERRSGLHPSDKELMEQCSGTKIHLFMLICGV
jgi:hypothetical protein